MCIRDRDPADVEGVASEGSLCDGSVESGVVGVVEVPEISGLHGVHAFDVKIIVDTIILTSNACTPCKPEISGTSTTPTTPDSTEPSQRDPSLATPSTSA